jgi:RimJ/RimL family protein N-acetyltransferase
MPIILTTDRLTLRPLALEDFPAYVDFWQDNVVVRFIAGSPLSREQVWKRLLGTVGHWQLLGYGFFAIEENATGKFMGEAGFQEMRRDLVPSIEGTLETGWALLPEFHGQGYATEAVRAAMDWADRSFPDQDYSCIIGPENLASMRLAMRLGFARDVISTYMGNPVEIWRKPRAR